MSSMYLLEAVNYQDPPVVIMITSRLLMLGILIAFFFSRSILVGLFGGAISWAFIAYCEAGLGTGSSTSDNQAIGVVVGFVFGAVLSLIAGLSGKIYFRVKKRIKDRQKKTSQHEQS